MLLVQNSTIQNEIIKSGRRRDEKGKEILKETTNSHQKTSLIFLTGECFLCLKTFEFFELMMRI